jgi:Nucleoside 2-deoxyribosyltransferase like
VRVIAAPDDSPVTDGSKTLFLSGGITGAPDWQQEFITMLGGTGLVIYNPRLVDFDERLAEARPQIKWEFDRLAWADAISFWFPAEAKCVITLHELGQWLPKRVMLNNDGDEIVGYKRIFIGVHPDYARRVDVEIQADLVRPGIEIVNSLFDLSEMVRTWSDEPYL